jgi:hypothetical protein
MLAVDLDSYNNRVKDTLRIQKKYFFEKIDVKSNIARYDAREFYPVFDSDRFAKFQNAC